MARSNFVGMRKILSEFDEETLEGLAVISRSPQLLKAIQISLNFSHRQDRSSIINAASGIHSLDGLIDSGLTQSFSRGRISLAEQFFQMVQLSSEFLDKKIEKIEKKANKNDTASSK